MSADNRLDDHIDDRINDRITQLFRHALQESAADFFPESSPFAATVPQEDDFPSVWQEIAKTLLPAGQNPQNPPPSGNIHANPANIVNLVNTVDTVNTVPAETVFVPSVPISPVSSPSAAIPAVPVPPVPVSSVSVPRDFDIAAIRSDFPILAEKVHGKPLVWFDNGATTQKPQIVIDRLKYFYEHENSNVHRGAHDLAARATDAYENARKTVQKFLNASSPNEIIFVRGTTEAINLAAATWGRDNIHRGDEILLSHLEHHANIVPWQLLAQETGAVIKVIPVDSNGDLLLHEYTRLLRSGNVKLAAVTQVSNALGTVTPAAEMIQTAHQFGAKVLIDGAQSVAHLAADVQALNADFFVFSGHKIFAPTGIGVLYGKEEILQAMRPYQGGGGMIADVTFEKAEYQPAPGRFEAGTGNIADAAALGTALDYVCSVGLESIRQYEHRLLTHTLNAMEQIPGLRIIGNPRERAGVISFVHDRLSTEVISKALAAEGIALRSGHHCAQPILRRFGCESTVRASLAFYNTFDEADFFVQTLKSVAVR